MQIKSSHGRPLLARLREAAFGRSGKRGLIALYTLLVFAGGVAVHRAGLVGDAKSALSTQTVTHAARRLQGLFATPERLTIDIRHTDFMALVRHRDVALASGVLQLTAEDYVPGDVRHGGRTIPVRLRLKGDLVDHLEGNKWSFRIVARRDSTLFGMRQFSLQHPEARAYVYEKLYQEVMRREGILALRYDFVDVTLNGKSLGIYALEEHFEKRLVEHNERPEGPIVRFNEDVLWAQIADQHSIPGDSRAEFAGAGDYFASDIDAFQTTRWIADTVAFKQYLTAIHLLEAFRRGELSTSETFDTKQLATFFALSDLLSATHGVGNWHNVRFYYNPITSRLEPIAFDGYNRRVPGRSTLLAVRSRAEATDPDKRRYLSRFLDDRAFYEEYISELERVSDPAYLAALIEDIAPVVDGSLRILRREFPEVEFSWQPIRRGAEFIRIALYPPKGVQAYLGSVSPGSVDLVLGNMVILPVEVLGLTRDSARFDRTAPVELPGRLAARPITFESVDFAVPRSFSWPDTFPAPLRLSYRVVGTRRLSATDVLPWPPEGTQLQLGDAVRRVPNIRSFDFLTIDEAERRIGIRPGSWRTDRDLIIPAGYQVYAGPGTTLDLRNGASIVSRSPLRFRGEADDPIVVLSSDSTGGGLIVLQAGGRSLIEGARFEGLSNPAQTGWEVPGAVTFYESPVDVIRSHFVGSRSEDGLHIVRSGFSLDEVTFQGAFSDALDIDFGHGTIRRASFLVTGNDAIDASGSIVEVEGIVVREAGDKGLSAGENSRLTGRDVTLHDAAIGIASKDLSTVRIRDVRLVGGGVGLTAYRKKTEFGPGTITVWRLQMSGPRVPYMIEVGSSATVDGRSIPADRVDVADVLYGVEYGKSSE